MARETTVIKNSCLTLGTTPGYMTLDDITAEFKSIRRMPIVEAGAAYTEASTALTKAANDLVTHATKLAQAWGGEAADKHLAQFQKLHETVTGLADKSFVAGRAHTWLGGEDMLGWYQDTGANLKAGFFHTDGDDADAREFRDRFLNRLAQAVNGGPDSVAVNLPDPTQDSGYGPPSSGAPHVGAGGPGAGSGLGSGGAGAGGMPKMPTDHAGGLPNGGLPGGGAPTGHGGGLPGGDPSGNLPGGGSGGGLPGGDPSGNLPGGGLPGDGSSLQNFPGDGAGGLGSGGLGSSGLGGGGLGGGGLGSGGLGGGGLGGGAGGLPGGGLGGGGGGLPGSGLSGGAGGLPGSGLSGAGAANEALAAERAALSGAGGAGGMGMPMGGGGGGGGDQSEETERSTWLTEDEDIWGGNCNTTSAVIGI